MVGQSIEHLITDQKVEGSSPSKRTRNCQFFLYTIEDTRAQQHLKHNLGAPRILANTYMLMNMTSMTIFTIATGKYFGYFLRLLPELRRYSKSSAVQVVCLASRSVPASFGSERFSVEILPIPDLPWPEITLNRYEEILRNSGTIKGDTFIWLDADTQVLSGLNPESLFEAGKISVAKHPGFLPPTLIDVLTRRRSIGGWFRSFVQRVLKPSFERGAWETRDSSQSYVPADHRMHYVQGSAWGGPTVSVLEMCRELASRTIEDKNKGIVAVWHDESHLNWWVANRVVKFLPNRFLGFAPPERPVAKETVVRNLDKEYLDKSNSAVFENWESAENEIRRICCPG